MSFSYSGKPGESTQDEVRFHIGDTDPCDPQLLDGEISFLLTKYSDNALRAAIAAVMALEAKFSRLVSESVGSISISCDQKAENYRKLLKTLRRQFAIENGKPFSGALDISQKDILDDDTDRVRPAFERDTHENEKTINTQDEHGHFI